MDTQIKATPDLTVIDEKEIRHILEPGEVGAILELILTDKDGKITEKRVMKSKSFVRQFLELLYIQMYQISELTTYTLQDTGNVSRTISESAHNFGCAGAAADITNGIVVGTGAVAPTINDYHLGAIIAHGAGAGQLQYSAVTFGLPASDTTTSQFTITRNFANASGGAVTVNEIGLYVKGYDPTTAYYFMAIRDVIAGGISVPNGQTLTVNYREQAVV